MLLIKKIKSNQIFLKLKKKLYSQIFHYFNLNLLHFGIGKNILL